MGEERDSEGRGREQSDGRTWAKRAAWDPDAGDSRSLAGPSLGSGWGDREFRTTACGAQREGPSPLEGGAAVLTCALPGSPPVTLGVPKGPWSPAIPGLCASPTRSRAAQVLLFRTGGQRCSLVGLGEGRTCSTLTTEVTFPAPGSGPASHPSESPSPFLPASFPRRGALVSLKPE